jgi:hypothetical protein
MVMDVAHGLPPELLESPTGPMAASVHSVGSDYPFDAIHTSSRGVISATHVSPDARPETRLGYSFVCRSVLCCVAMGRVAKLFLRPMLLREAEQFPWNPGYRYLPP